MSIEVTLALAGGLITASVSVGVYIGVLKGQVDTLKRDMNSAFRMIRELQTSREK